LVSCAVSLLLMVSISLLQKAEFKFENIAVDKGVT